MRDAISDPEEARLQRNFDEVRERVERWISGERRLLLQGTDIESMTEDSLMEFIAADEDKPRDFADFDKGLEELRAYRSSKESDN